MALLTCADALLPRRLDVIGRDRDAFEADAGAESGFLRRVLEQPKQWVIGGPEWWRPAGASLPS